jgi:hypothetical protein
MLMYVRLCKFDDFCLHLVAWHLKNTWLSLVQNDAAGRPSCSSDVHSAPLRDHDPAKVLERIFGLIGVTSGCLARV